MISPPKVKICEEDDLPELSNQSKTSKGFCLKNTLSIKSQSPSGVPIEPEDTQKSEGTGTSSDSNS